jgi:acetoin utilization deacetylase AcuC-like enzyme
VNVPWPESGMGDSEYIYAFQKVIMPIALEFAPELILSKFTGSFFTSCLILYPVSAGFDAAVGDDLGECLVSPAGYAHMTHMLAGLAGGRMAVALEVIVIVSPYCYHLKTVVGWLQSRLNLKFCSSSHESPARRSSR